MPEHEGDPSFRAAGQDAGKDERHSLWRRDWRSHQGSAFTLNGRRTVVYTTRRPAWSSRVGRQGPLAEPYLRAVRRAAEDRVRIPPPAAVGALGVGHRTKKPPPRR